MGSDLSVIGVKTDNADKFNMLQLFIPILATST